MYVNMYTCVYTYIYIYMYREREIYIYIYIYTHTHTCVYIYIYIYNVAWRVVYVWLISRNCYMCCLLAANCFTCGLPAGANKQLRRWIVLDVAYQLMKTNGQCEGTVMIICCVLVCENENNSFKIKSDEFASYVVYLLIVCVSLVGCFCCVIKVVTISVGIVALTTIAVDSLM